MGLGSGSALNSVAHPFRLRQVGRFFPAVVTIEQATETQAEDGRVVETWTAVPDLVNLHGNIAIAASSEKDLAAFTSLATRRILNLGGAYVVTETMRARVMQGEAETVYGITAVGRDSLAHMTRLELEVLSH